MEKKGIQAPMGETRVLLHTCCAPCSSAIIEALIQNGITPVIYYCNPNIYPQEEYEIRKNECTRYAESLGLEIIDADYDHENWLEAVQGLEDEPERGGRCLKCFKLRLLRTAEYARQRGIKVITTTLASSRWKSLDQIDEAGLWACGQVSGDVILFYINAHPRFAVGKDGDRQSAVVRYAEIGQVGIGKGRSAIFVSRYYKIFIFFGYIQIF